MGLRDDDAYDLLIASVKKAAPAANGADLIVEAEALLGGERRALAIAVKTELAPLVAVSLLSALSSARASRPGGEPAEAQADAAPALLCLAAGIVASPDPTLLRVHLQFDSGVVLPVEMPRDAAVALLRGLADELAPSVSVAKPRARTRKTPKA